VQIEAVGVFHDVRFVNGGDFLPLVLAGIVRKHSGHPLAAAFAHRLMLTRFLGLGLDLLVGRELVNRFDQLSRVRLARLEFDARVEVLRVFADDDDIDADLAKCFARSG